MKADTQIETQVLVRQIINETLQLSDCSYSLNADLAHDLGADSIDYSYLIIKMEKAFDIVIFDDKFHELKTVGDVIRFIEEKVAIEEQMALIEEESVH